MSPIFPLTFCFFTLLSEMPSEKMREEQVPRNQDTWLYFLLPVYFFSSVSFQQAAASFADRLNSLSLSHISFLWSQPTNGKARNHHHHDENTNLTLILLGSYSTSSFRRRPTGPSMPAPWPWQAMDDNTRRTSWNKRVGEEMGNGCKSFFFVIIHLHYEPEHSCMHGSFFSSARP